MIYLSGLYSFLDESFSSHHLTSNKGDSYDNNFECSCSFFNLNEKLMDIKDVTFIDFYWSYCMFIANGEAYLFGYLNENSGQICKLTMPDQGFVIQGSIGRKRCHLVTREGAYWMYTQSTGEWKNIGQLLRSEKVNDDLSDPEKSECDETLSVVKVSCGDQMVLAVTDVGYLYSVPSLLELRRIKVTDVACGKEHSLLLTTDFTVYSWGCGSRGQLGHGELEGEEHPRELAALSGIKVTAIEAGGWHSCCLTDEGDLYTCGWNCAGQLGFPGEENQSVTDVKLSRVPSVLAEPKPVDWPGNLEVNVKQVACGARHTVVLLDDKTVWGCGWNGYYQLQRGLPKNVFCMAKLILPFNEEVKKVVCGEWNSAFIT